VPSWEASFTTWPPAEVEPTALDFAGGDAGLVLSRDAPGSGRTATFTTAPEEGRVTIVDDLAAVWTAAPGWDWPPAAPARSIVAATEPLAGDLVRVGPASADLWLSADAPDADVEVTLSELAPDGTETYIQNGWLRLSRRALAPESTELRPVPSSLDGDVSPLVPGAEPVLARVEILPFAHVVRAGSRLRITIDTPGASRPSWQFDVLAEPVAVTLHTGPDHPSRLVVPALPNLEVPTERPACGWLRGQPCR
jgi:predicted acyl esterase